MNKEKISKKPKHLTVKEFAVELLSQANNANEQEAKIIIFAGEGSRYEVTVKSDDAMEDGNIIKRYEMKCRIKNKQMSPDSNLCARIKPMVFSI